MHIFHNWSNWESYETTVLSCFYGIPCKSTNVRQFRRCDICGKTQDEYVSNKQFVSLTKNNIPATEVKKDD